MPRVVAEEPEVRPNYIYKKDVEEFGATEGCPGCRALLNPNSRYRARHTQECRDRMEAEMAKASTQGAMRVIRAQERNNSAKAKAEEAEKRSKGQEEDESDSKKGRHGDNADESKHSSSSAGSREAPQEESKDSEMNAEAGESEELEEAPHLKGDIRVPLAERKPAVKRSRDPDNKESPRGSKWVACETEVGGTKRTSEGLPDSERDKFQAIEDTGKGQGKPTDSVDRHPGPRTKEDDIEKCEMTWKDIGSGTVARTFVGATKLLVSTRGGPPEIDVYRRTVWNLSTGRIIDDCIVEDTPDQVLL